MDYRGRIGEMVEWMRENGVDLVLLFDRDNIRYFTGFRLNQAANSILALDREGRPTYAVAQLDLERAKRDCWIEDIVLFSEDTLDYLAVLGPLLRGPVRCIGVEQDVVTLTQSQQLRKLARNAIEFVDVRPFTAALRMIKSEEELACIRKAAAIADRVFEKLLPEIRPGVTEAEIVGMVEYLLRVEGAEGASFEPFMMSGENAWLPQRVASRKVLREGELAVLDMGARYEGYCSDLTRTLALGEPTAEQRRIFQVAWTAQQVALEAIRPGAIASEVDHAAREVITAAGLSNYSPHLIGHGVGISIHEPPILDRGVDIILQPGMVITVEPGIYLPGVGAARVEDMVVVTSAGYELLTTTRRDLV